MSNVFSYDAEYISGSLSEELGESFDLRHKQLPNNLQRSAAEQLLYSKDRLPVSLQPYAVDIARQFNWRSYQCSNKDLAGMTPVQLVDHYLEHGISEWRHCHTEEAKLMDRRYAIAAKLNTDVHLSTDFQAVVHCFHFKILEYLAPYLRNIARLGGRIILMVSNDLISESSLESFLGEMSSGAASHRHYRVANRGEDWSSFHEAYKIGIFDDNGVTVKMQTKKSAHLGLDGGNVWIDEALGSICGTNKTLTEALEAISHEGALVLASSLIRFKGFGANPSLVKKYISRLKLEKMETLMCSHFAGGSMFAASNSYIRQFYQNLGDIDYKEEVAGGNEFCGRFIGHALERVFFYYAGSFDEPDKPAVRWVV
jgi:hypothetical protein